MERFNSTADDHEKNVLRKRLITLQSVKQFLVSAETDTTVNPPHSKSPRCMSGYFIKSVRNGSTGEYSLGKVRR
jgi:hypothetical protein